jgi:two-component system, OmpR family, heavy metal sensor histidine kinase CusS
MFSKRADASNFAVDNRWAMSTWLTLYYTIFVFVLLTAASAFLYSGLERRMDQESREYLLQKVQILGQILQDQQLSGPDIKQEVWEEAEISGRLQSSFFLRVLDAKEQLVAETPGMASDLPISAFPAADSTEPQLGHLHSTSRQDFLLASAAMPPSSGASSRLYIEAAVNVSSEQSLLSTYRRYIAIVLVSGVLIASAVGAIITRHGLRPIADITRATEHIGVQHLQDRIRARPWPKELVSLAGAFDRMLERLQEAFEQLSQFSADVAHEFRTPINNLTGEAQVALSRERTTAEYTRVLQSALEEYTRLAGMIDSMLFLAQAEQAPAVLASVSLEASGELQAVCDFYHALAEEQGVELACEGQTGITADPMLLRRALSNLLSNALKYTPRGGRVTLRAAKGPGTTRTLSVIDSGVGIASEHLAKLGDRFYRADPSRGAGPGGAGLGLAIVRSIMTLHGGSLLIDSTVGRGTTASLVFSSGPLSDTESVRRPFCAVTSMTNRSS